jgi:hypothetical protein
MQKTITINMSIRGRAFISVPKIRAQSEQEEKLTMDS